MHNLKFFALFFFAGLMLLEAASCSKANKVNGKYLGEYSGTIGYADTQDPNQTIYEEAMLSVEKKSKNKYLVSSPTHPGQFPETVYIINKLLSNVDTAGQVGVEEGPLGQSGTLILSDDADSVRVFVTRDDPQGYQVVFEGSKPQ